MAIEVITNAKIFFDGYDLSGRASKIALQVGADAKECTVMGDTGKRRLAALLDAAVQADGYDLSDAALHSEIAAANVPLSIVPDGPAEGNLAYFFRALAGQYMRDLQVGETYKFSLKADGSSGEPPLRGTLCLNGTKTVTGTGTGFQLGALSATQKIYGALHVFGVNNPADTLTVTVESAPDNTFAAPTTRLTFTAVSAVGSGWQSLLGAVTDTWWRVKWTIAGATPSFPFAVSLGIK